MIADSVLTALIAAGAALSGSALANWSAARQQIRQDRRQAEKDSQALLRQKREECMGWVLEARTRIESVMPGLGCLELGAVPADKTPVAAARQAYAVALLYLADVRPSAKAFYQSTAKLQLALTAPIGEDGVGVPGLVDAWRKDFEALETGLEKMSDASLSSIFTCSPTK